MKMMVRLALAGLLASGLSPGQIPIPDLVCPVERSSTALPGTWAEVLRHEPGQECSTGSLNGQLFHSSPSVHAEFPQTVGSIPRFFTRFRFELRSPP